MNRAEIAPGVFVTNIPGEKFKRCKIAIHLVVQSNRQDATALALLPSILGRRCQAIPDARQLAMHLFNLYGAGLTTDSYTMGENRVVTVGMTGLKNEFALNGEDLAFEYLDLACNLLFAPYLENGVFATEDVEIEKEKQADYLKSEMNEKRSYCLRQARRKLFGENPLGIEASGYLADIETITPAGLYDVYASLVRQAQIEVVVCGADGAMVTKTILERLKGVQRKLRPLQPAKAFVSEKAYEEFAEGMDTAQGKICILLTSGKVLDDKGEAVMRVANSILGALPTSRLFTNVREKQSLCYYCTSAYSGFSGVLSMDSGVDHANAEKAGKAMMKELEQLQTALVTPEELEQAKKALKNVFDTAKDSPGALSNWVFVQQLRGSSLDLDEVSKMVQEVTAEEIQSILATFEPALEYCITGKEKA